ncbi:MAG: hypothetical protein QOG46_37, partial [Pseudonocardiales bacterium]|nr:hypothetical protein [Pseudonocardiales bacterium]
PTGESGTDIGGGVGLPGFGASEESIGGGGAICCRHAGCAAAGAVPRTIIAADVRASSAACHGLAFAPGEGEPEAREWYSVL